MRHARNLALATCACFLFALSLSVSALPGPAPHGTGAAPTRATATATGSAVTGAGSRPDPETPASSTEPAGRRTALIAGLTLKVPNAKDTKRKLQARAVALGGFSVLVTARELQVKVPPRVLSTLVDGMSEEGLVVDKSLERADLTLDIARLEAQLKSKRAILAELRGFFDGSDVAATLEIERTMTTLVEELEAVKGLLRVLNDRADWALVRITFDIRQREQLSVVTSPFEWLNSVNLPRFLSEF